MPEIRECIAFFFMVLAWFRKAQQNKCNLRIVRMLADAVDTISKKTGIDENLLAPTRLPFILTPDCPPIMRGHQNTQFDLYPPPLRRTDDVPNPAAIQSYTLVSVDKTMRSLILEFKGDNGEELWLKLSYLTHTCVQVYTAAQWAIVVNTPKPRTGDKEKKRARIGLAIEMESHTLAFVSNDLLFEPIWTRTKAALPNVYLGVYDQDYCDYLQVVADWMAERENENERRTRRAWDAIRLTQSVFMGVGVYTASELLFDAGIPPWISEAELVDCPSRMARLCEALWSYAFRSYTELNKLISPAMAQGVLAPTTEHRLSYHSWLHVWAREYSHMPERMCELAQAYTAYIGDLSALQEEKDGKMVAKKWFRDETTDLYDIFDPYFVGAALSDEFRRGQRGNLLAEKSVDLGDLIFSDEEWFAISGRRNIKSNPLKTYYQARGLLNAHTYLKPNHYTALGIRGIPAGVAAQSQVWFDTYSYYKDKQYWSVFRMLPKNSLSSRRIKGPKFDAFRELTGAERKGKYFQYIVTKTEKVAIGPLEYSASGTQARTTHGEKAQVPFSSLPFLAYLTSHSDSVYPLKHSSRQQTLAFHRASRSACSSTASLVMQDSEVEHRVDEDDNADEAEAGDHADPPATSASEGEMSDYAFTDEDDRITLPPPPLLSTSTSASTSASTSRISWPLKRLPLQLFGSDAEDNDDEEGEARPRKSRRSAALNPKAGYTFSKRGYAPRRKEGKGK